jgi:hypothetical protein
LRRKEARRDAIKQQEEARLPREEVSAAAQANQQFMQLILINLVNSNNRETITPYGFNYPTETVIVALYCSIWVYFGILIASYGCHVNTCINTRLCNWRYAYTVLPVIPYITCKITTEPCVLVQNKHKPKQSDALINLCRALLLLIGANLPLGDKNRE